jgi:hypothetical protein
MGNSEGSTDEDIGRPGPWKEGRYQRSGQSVDQSVHTPAENSTNSDKPASAPVTREDYEFSDSATDSNSEPPGGDAG